MLRRLQRVPGLSNMSNVCKCRNNLLKERRIRWSWYTITPQKSHRSLHYSYSTQARAIRSNNQDKKSKTIYVCEDCGEDFAQWHGKCPNCSAWNTLKQLKIAKSAPETTGGGGAAIKAISNMEDRYKRESWLEDEDRPMLLKDIDMGKDNAYRMKLTAEEGMEFSRVLGGGIVPGSMTLVGGDPGVGKSTLLLQVANLLATETSQSDKKSCVLYVSGEESTPQLAIRAVRLGIDPENSKLFLYSATNLEQILAVVAKIRPTALIIDSIQTVYLEAAKGTAGSVGQIRECAIGLLQLAKSYQIATFVIGHVTKMGEIAGPRVLEHLVDVVLYLEGERFEHHRLLRSVKNRFGATDEIGVFEMTGNGLKPVSNPSEIFASQSSQLGGISPAVTATMEGSRPLLVEIQALCSDIQGGTNDSKYIRSANGINYSRLFMLLAVLSKHAGIYLGNRSLFINVTGGFKLQEPATDLAVVMAIVSSYLERRIFPGTAFIGEIGLGGELRPVGQIDRRVSEAAKIGFSRAVIPYSNQGYPDVEGIEIIPCKTVRQAIESTLEKSAQNS